MKIFLDKKKLPSLNNSILFSIYDSLKSQGCDISIESDDNLLIFYDAEILVNNSSDIKDCCLMFFSIERIKMIIKLIVKYKKIFLLINKNYKFLNSFSSYVGVKFLYINDFIEVPNDLFLNLRCVFPESKIYKNNISISAKRKFLYINNKMYYPVLRRSLLKKIKISKFLNL